MPGGGPTLNDALEMPGGGQSDEEVVALEMPGGGQSDEEVVMAEGGQEIETVIIPSSHLAPTMTCESGVMSGEPHGQSDERRPAAAGGR